MDLIPGRGSSKQWPENQIFDSIDCSIICLVMKQTVLHVAAVAWNGTENGGIVRKAIPV